jgi:hypothetical protein
MSDTFINLVHSLGLALISGFHASELLVTLLVAIGFLIMAAQGREHADAEDTTLDHEHHRWLSWNR